MFDGSMCQTPVDKNTSQTSDSKSSLGESSPSSSPIFTFGRGTLTIPKSVTNCSASDTDDGSYSSAGSISRSIDSNSDESSHQEYEWKRSLIDTERYLTFKFVDDGTKDFFPRDAAIAAIQSLSSTYHRDFDADLLEKHGAQFPHFDDEVINVYKIKYESSFIFQNMLPMRHFLAMMRLGVVEETKRDEKWKYKLHESDSELDLQEPRKMERKMKKKNKFKMKRESILENEANIWNRCLDILNPSYAAEVFYSQGVNLVCVTSLKSIYEIERASLKYFTDYESINLSDSQKELIAFMKEICIDETKGNKHFLGRLCSKIYNGVDDAYTTRWIETSKRYMEKMAMEKMAMDRFHAMRGYLKMVAVHRSHTSFHEKDLRFFLLLLLNESQMPKHKLQSLAINAATIEIKQLRQAKSGCKIRSQKTTPDVEYWEDSNSDILQGEKIQVMQILICELKAPSESTAENWKPPMETEMFEGSLLSTKIKCTFLWQIYEAMFGTMMNAEHDEKMLDENHVVFQGGMLVCNDRVRSVVLAMNGKMYKNVRQNICAKETFELAMQHPMWARLYIEGHDHHILDALSRVTFTYNNFCKCVPTKVKS